RATRKLPLVPLLGLRRHRPLAGMWLLRPGARLSITPVTPAEWKYVLAKLVRG
ncbi:MAG: EVE domain-containing protein, partial [Betaproteobacteria bacterium]|nr:EVE domain-containing protein [Betaproteobacteria bacterium]